MSNFRSAVEQAVQLQLQHFTRFRTPIPLVTVLLASSPIQTVGRASSASVSALAILFRKFLAGSSTSESLPLLGSLFDIFTCALNALCLRARICVKVPIQWRQMFDQGHGRPRSGDDTHSTPRAEARYWHVAERYRLRLYGGENLPSAPSTMSMMSQGATAIPLVTYYTPRLLPPYRDRGGEGRRASRETTTDVQDCRMSPKTFCKWHRMVFQNARHPTLLQAALQMKYYSNRDLREIRRIARLLPDEQVFGRKRRGARKANYSEMWENWLENKGLDLVIVFE